MAMIGLKYPIAAPCNNYIKGRYPEIEPGTAFVVGKMISAEKDIKFSDNPLWADDEKAEDNYAFEEGTLKICVDHMTLEAQSKMYGHVYTAADNSEPERLVKGGSDIPPYHVFGYFKTLMKNNKKLYQVTIVYKTKFKPPKESAKTKEKSISWGTYESEGTIETLSGFENDPYEEVTQFSTEEEARKYLEDYFKLSDNSGTGGNTESGSESSGDPPAGGGTDNTDDNGGTENEQV
ncbi:MAG: hypothetical protein HDT21_07025 [Ruminococcus sp.]|nr:hypothetical protein [Ruminococcus sp.]